MDGRIRKLWIDEMGEEPDPDMTNLEAVNYLGYGIDEDGEILDDYGIRTGVNMEELEDED